MKKSKNKPGVMGRPPTANPKTCITLPVGAKALALKILAKRRKNSFVRVTFVDVVVQGIELVARSEGLFDPPTDGKEALREP